MSQEAYIVKGYRTAVGKAPKGLFRFKRPDELAAETINYMINDLPNLEKLMKQGVRFSNFWTYPTCTPTRSTIITGKFGYRTNVLNVRDRLSLNEFLKYLVIIVVLIILTDQTSGFFKDYFQLLVSL